MSNHAEIGYYGNARMIFMEENHQKQAAQGQNRSVFENVAQFVNHIACEYNKLLADQYSQQNPPLDDPKAYRTWKYPRDYYINDAVMREQMLLPHTKI